MYQTNLYKRVTNLPLKSPGSQCFPFTFLRMWFCQLLGFPGAGDLSGSFYWPNSTKRNYFWWFQKSCDHQLVKVVYPIIYKVYIHSRWCRISSINSRYILIEYLEQVLQVDVNGPIDIKKMGTCPVQTLGVVESADENRGRCTLEPQNGITCLLFAHCNVESGIQPKSKCAAKTWYIWFLLLCLFNALLFFALISQEG